MKELKNVELYIKAFCPYCQRVLSYLKQNNIEYKSTDVTLKPKLYKELKQKTGLQTVPQIYVNGEFVGGSDDFFAYIK